MPSMGGSMRFLLGWNAASALINLGDGRFIWFWLSLIVAALLALCIYLEDEPR